MTAQPTLTIDAGERPIRGKEELHLHVLAMAAQSRRRIRIFSHDLEPTIYDQPDVLDALSRLARRSRFSRVEILVFDPRPAVRDSHRLIELARRLSSFIELRQVHADYLQDPTSFALFDDSGYVYRPQHAQYQGYGDYHAPHVCLEKHKYFQEVWEKSSPVQEFRRLYL